MHYTIQYMCVYVPLEISARIMSSFWKTLGGLYAFCFPGFRGRDLCRRISAFTRGHIEFDEGVRAVRVKLCGCRADARWLDSCGLSRFNDEI